MEKEKSDELEAKANRRLLSLSLSPRWIEQEREEGEDDATLDFYFGGEMTEAVSAPTIPRRRNANERYNQEGGGENHNI